MPKEAETFMGTSVAGTGQVWANRFLCSITLSCSLLGEADSPWSCFVCACWWFGVTDITSMMRIIKQTKNFKNQREDALLCCPLKSQVVHLSLSFCVCGTVFCTGNLVVSGQEPRAAPSQLELEVLSDLSKVLNNKIKFLCIYSRGCHFWSSFPSCRCMFSSIVICLQPLPFFVTWICC